MAPEARVLGLQCLRCRARFEEPRLFAGCPRCRAEGIAVNLTVAYDLVPLAGVTPETFGTAARGLWRFRPLLPVRPAHPVSLGEGATPLVHLERLGRRLGLPRLYAKDESQNPTWSYKDRLCATAVTHAVETGARVITISSTGNHGASTAAYAAHDRRRTLRSSRARAGAWAAGAGAGRGSRAVRRVLHRLTLRHLAASRRVARLGRRRRATDRRGRAGGTARAGARGRPLRRALVGGVTDGRHAARRAPGARRGADDRRRAHLRRPQGPRGQPRVAAAGAGRRRRFRSSPHRSPRGLWTGAGPIASVSR